MASKLQAIVNASHKDLETSMKLASQRFGFSKLKEQQKNAVEATLCGKDVFVSLPTGFGKSLIYQLLPVCAEELAILNPVGPDFKPFVVIVSPLVSLMQDQVAALRDKGFKASLCVSHRDRVLESDPCALQSVYIFASPEGLLGTDHWRTTILSDTFRENILVLVIDEAHCAAKW